MRAALALAAALALTGCIAPITPMERLQQSANEVAGALRFGRSDLAAEYCSNTAREDFLARHAVWGKNTRVVDLELSGIYLRASDEAESIIVVSWLREDGAMLHTTEIAQRWKHERGTFQMVDEVFRSGDKALFDMLPKKVDPKKAGAGKGAEASKGETAGAPANAAEGAAAGATETATAEGAAAPPWARFETRVIRAE